MPLPSFLQRKPKAERSAAPADANAVEAARTRARRRLIGAVVLLAAGVIGFPLLFETQPRPVSNDVPIEVAGKREIAVAPAPKSSKPAVPKAVAPPPPDAGQEAPASAPVAVAEAKPEPKVEPKAEAKPEPKPEPKREAKPEPKVEPKPEAKAVAKVDDGNRAKALLDNAAAASQAKAPARFIVQVGAYTDAESVKEARAKVEKLGLSSYTQVIEADGTRRVRVRVGPFASREEADKVGAKLKTTGLPVHVLTL